MAQHEPGDEFRPAVFIPAHPVDLVAEQPTMPAPSPENGSGPLSLARVGDELLQWMKTIVSAAVYATLIVTFGFQVARVDGQSMIPTLEDQDRLIVNKAAYLFGEPQIGDVVMHYWPEDPSKSFVKRIVAGPGDTIRSENGRVYRNDVLVDDSFIPEENRSYDSWGPTVVKKGYYFVMGDHRNNSLDSRAWEGVPKKYILGKIQVRWWPLGHAHIF
jgi:signal peptidase I